MKGNLAAVRLPYGKRPIRGNMETVAFNAISKTPDG